MVPTDNNTGCRHIIEKTQSESIHGVQLCTKRVETREKVYPIEECLKRSRKSTYEMTYNGCVLCGKQHFSLYCPEM